MSKIPRHYEVISRDLSNILRHYGVIQKILKKSKFFCACLNVLITYLHSYAITHSEEICTIVFFCIFYIKYWIYLLQLIKLFSELLQLYYDCFTFSIEFHTALNPITNIDRVIFYHPYKFGWLGFKTDNEHTSRDTHTYKNSFLYIRL